MTESRTLTIDDLSDAEVEMLKLRPEAKFSADGKTVELPADTAPSEDGIPDFAAGVKKLAVPPPPDHIAKRLVAGFAPPQSSIVVEEDGKVVKSEGTASAPPAEKAYEAQKATEADLADYLRCILGGKPFMKTYEFMGGHVKVTVRERTADEEEDVIRRTAMTAAAQNQAQNALVLTILMSKYRLAYSIVRLEIGIDNRLFDRIAVGAVDPVSKAFVVDRRIAELGDLPGTLSAVINIALMQFTELGGDIARRATDPKSWQTPPAV